MKFSQITNNTWYKYKNCYIFRNNNKISGFSAQGFWLDKIAPNNFDEDGEFLIPDIWKEITPLIIIEAQRRNIYDTKQIISLGSESREYAETFYEKSNSFYTKYGRIFNKGEWAVSKLKKPKRRNLADVLDDDSLALLSKTVDFPPLHPNIKLVNTEITDEQIANSIDVQKSYIDRLTSRYIKENRQVLKIENNTNVLIKDEDELNMIIKIANDNDYRWRSHITSLHPFSKQVLDNIKSCLRGSSLLIKFYSNKHMGYATDTNTDHYITFKEFFNLNTNTNEVPRKIAKQRQQPRKGIKILGRKIKAKSSSGFTGSRVTNLRRKAKPRSSEIEGTGLQFD